MNSELTPLLKAIEPIREIESAREVYDYVTSLVNTAATASMAQSACEKIIVMCHPKAWGDLNVQGYGESWTDWFKFLDNLSDVANQCGQAVFDHQVASK